ncbi:hypothetical protein M409DRAFT_54017 [Zasmidium cellare ATCC 36951]|uniref:6-methylsalicylate decarboxylase n=1 Tax=Zasmidium cellare ATCC 36951 TaxID=1080233 RepID=A0A6A6CPM2_ZASCE|nr:uncharacterized protein M409DRAFT_54017 [Zasmidium cellare ATCC 36951]KAF2167416.1 hypothetical protein M409DRAFT_54017 [Zasmidium cellare ATCC 36951]
MRENKFLIDPNFSWSIDKTLATMDAHEIQMGMLGCPVVPSSQIREANIYGAELVRQHPTRLGLLCGLPTDDAEACLREIEFGRDELHCDGFWVNPIRNGVKLSDPSLDAVWARLDELKAVVWAHPDPNDPSVDGRPGALMEVTYEMQRVIIDQVYRKHFLRFPRVRHVYANCAGGFLANEEIEEQVQKLWVDIAAAAEDGIGVSVRHLGAERVVFGSDTGAPCMCMNVETMEVNRQAMLKWERELGMEKGTIGMNGWQLFPEAAARAVRGSYSELE